MSAEVRTPRAPRRIAFRGGLACAVTLLVGCRGEHRILEDGCVIGEEVPIAELIGPAPHDVALVGAASPTHVVWSERAGLFSRALAEPSEIERLGPACDAGLATDGALLACARRGDDAKAQRGHVTVIDFATGEVRDQVVGVGPESFGVGVAASTGRQVVVWNDARGTTSSVWMHDVASGAASDPLRVSREGVRAGRPAARFEKVRGESHLVLAWPETWLGRDGVEGMLRVQRDQRLLDLEALGYDQSSPSVARDADGRAVVVFRDRRPARTRPRLFVRRLDSGDHAHDGVPANADGEALGVPCGGAMVVVAPRTHSRSERLVAVRRHDLATLEGTGPEHQIYMHGAAFEHADARCVGNDVLVVVASHATIERPHGAVSTVRFTCPSTEAPEP